MISSVRQSIGFSGMDIIDNCSLQVHPLMITKPFHA